MWQTEERTALIWACIGAMAIGCTGLLGGGCAPPARACDIIPATETCGRLLLCCEDAATCYVESTTEGIDCTETSCDAALEAVCAS